MRRLLPLILLFGGVACGGTAAGGPPDQGVVVSITDGDTVRVKLNSGGPEERIRLIGIDTPETHGRGGLRECFGQEASEHLAELIGPGTIVRLVIDAEPRDRYDRLLAYLYRVSDDLHVNLEMARAGYAAPLTIPPNVAFADAFVEASADAREQNRGLWAACGGADTPI